MVHAKYNSEGLVFVDSINVDPPREMTVMFSGQSLSLESKCHKRF
jgi:hypothetical protein